MVQIVSKRAERIKRGLFMFLLSSKELPAKSDALRLKNRITKYWDSLFRFIEQPATLQPTNNLAEQTVRYLVRIRRQTQGSHSEWGRDWAAKISSVIATCRKQKRSSWDFLVLAISAHNFGTKMPSLLPAA